MDQLFFNVSEKRNKAQVTQSSMEPLPMPQKLHFNITPEIKKDIEEAMQHIDKWEYLVAVIAFKQTMIRKTKIKK